MRKDLKIGMFIGLAFAFAAVFWVATRPVTDEQWIQKKQPEQTILNMPRAAAQNKPGPDLSGKSLPGPVEEKPPQPAEKAKVPEPVFREPEPQITPTPAPKLPRPQPARLIKPVRYHVVSRDETLSSIAEWYYGSAAKWPKIQQANPEILKDPNRLRIGMRLVIPQ